MAFLIPDNDIWIIGSSIITHAEEAAYAKNQGDLQLEGRQVLWFGSRGMHWCDLRPKVQWEMLNRPPPVMLVIHVVGNDLVNISQAKMMKKITKDISISIQSSHHHTWYGRTFYLVVSGLV